MNEFQGLLCLKMFMFVQLPLDETATYLGLGGRYCPGVALMNIHLQETIASAPPKCAGQIKVVENRFEAL